MDMSHPVHLASWYRIFYVHSYRIRGCMTNEHQKQIEADRGYTDARSGRGGGATHNPFAALQGLLKNKE